MVLYGARGVRAGAARGAEDTGWGSVPFLCPFEAQTQRVTRAKRPLSCPARVVRDPGGTRPRHRRAPRCPGPGTVAAADRPFGTVPHPVLAPLRCVPNAGERRPAWRSGRGRPRQHAGSPSGDVWNLYSSRVGTGPARVPPGSRPGPARVPAGSRPGPGRVPPGSHAGPRNLAQTSPDARPPRPHGSAEAGKYPCPPPRPHRPTRDKHAPTHRHSMIFILPPPTAGKVKGLN